MSIMRYNKRDSLNPLTSHYTGSVVCVDVENVINQGKVLERYTFVEISDCHGKVRLHRDNNLPMEDFVIKLRDLARNLTQFADFLEGNDVVL